MLNLDRLIVEFDKGLRTLFSQAHSARAYPDANVPEASMDEAEKKKAAALMRVNHSGEICAQALYQGQALTARDPAVQQKLQQAAQEETEHLAWTAKRVHELGGHLSLLNPFWYTGSLAIGAVAGLLGIDGIWAFLPRPSGKSENTCKVIWTGCRRRMRKAAPSWRRCTPTRSGMPIWQDHWAAQSCRNRYSWR